MKILITGSRGMMGTALCQSLSNHELLTPTKTELNVTRFSQVMSFRCDFIIHLACETDHEYCDENPSQCYLVNTIGTANMMRLARHLDVPVLYLSTASVFNGSKGQPYEWHDIPEPINHYNASKYYGELLLKEFKKHYIIRTGWLFGGGKTIDKKFVGKIMKKVLKGEKEIKVADDCVGSPTYNVDLGEYIKLMIEKTLPYGTYHAVNQSLGVSRYEFAKEIISAFGLDVKIIPCKIDELRSEFPCKRTNYEVLNSYSNMRDWKLALKEYLDANYRY